MLPPMSTPESSAAWHELLSAFADFDTLFLDGPKAVRGETAPSRGLPVPGHHAGHVAGRDAVRRPGGSPVLRPDDPVSPGPPPGRGQHRLLLQLLRWSTRGAPIGSAARPHDSDMYSLTVYNEPEPGAWPNRTVGLLYDEAMPLDADGRFSCVLGRVRPDGYDGPFIELSEDAHAILTRDYHEHPATGRRVDWNIEVIDHAGLAVVPRQIRSSVAASPAGRAALRQGDPGDRPADRCRSAARRTGRWPGARHNTLAPAVPHRRRHLRLLDAGRGATAWVRLRWNPVRH